MMIADFVEAFNAGDLARCVEFYADDASLQFMAKTYRGKPAIEQWLQQRFAAGAQILEIRETILDGESLRLEAIVTSRKLQAWRLPRMKGRAQVKLDAAGRIVECKLGAGVF